jgi:hypothetical protein
MKLLIVLITPIIFFSSADAQNVGIGTSSPTKAKLVINGVVGATNTIFGDNTSGVAIENSFPGVAFNSYYNSGRKFITTGYTGLIGLNPVNGDLYLYSSSTSGNANDNAPITPRMFINTLGNIGIQGNTAPQSPLSFGNTLGDKVNFWHTSDIANYGIGVQAALLQIYCNDASAGIAFGYGNSTNFTENMRIKGDGSIGMGISNPTFGQVQVYDKGINSTTFYASSYNAGTGAVIKAELIKPSGGAAIASYHNGTGYALTAVSNLGTGIQGGGKIGGDFYGSSAVGGYGLRGKAIVGVYGESSASGGFGVWASSGGIAGNTALWANGYSFFSGNVDVYGTLSKLGGTFKIDHPQDPANKFLYHSFVESPDMMNVYNGNITTDADGIAIVQLPGYFEAENIDYKYQLTIVGKQFAQAMVYDEIKSNKFTIKTDKPNIKVSWQVTGVRNDVYAQKNRVVPEVEKKGVDRGKYITPELFNQPISKSIYKRSN